MRTEMADWFPWLLPINAVVKEEPEPYLLAGALADSWCWP